jgi:tetratricopeptide (TPR) repeat protein
MGKARKSNNTRPDAPQQNVFWIYLALFLGTFAAYYQVRSFEFVEYDDPDYSLNPHVRNGITADALRWAITSREDSNWFPVTRISHLIDAQLFGSESGWHHLTNVLLHSVAALLLFAILLYSTGAVWRSALVALLFGVHPLHVESVAWVAERKDVLCALFWFLTLLVYLRYAKRPTWDRYLVVILVFSLGLMSKPMMVTLPFVLLLFDFWPLRRVTLHWHRALWEKVPLVALSAAASAIAYFAQRSTGALSMIRVSIGMRVENALVSYVAYIAKMFWPSGLAVLYPYPSSIPIWQTACAGLIVAGITALVLVKAHTLPYLTLGWFWYLGTLVPVIGLVQVGFQSHADRYTYIPLVGLFVMLSWGAGDIVSRWPRAQPTVVYAIAIGCALALVDTEIQLRYWRNSEALYARATAVTDGNYTMHYALGAVLAQKPGRVPEAIAEYRAALSTKPDYWEARDNLATLLSNTPDGLTEAIEQYKAALNIKPDSAELHNNFGTALAKDPARRLDAVAQYEEAIRLKADFIEAHSGLADTLARIPGRLPEAAAQYETVLRLKPDSIAAHYNLGVIYSNMPGRTPDAIAQLEAVLRVRPSPQLRQIVERLRNSERP